MTDFSNIIEIALLVLVALLLGCIIGLVLRRLWNNLTNGSGKQKVSADSRTAQSTPSAPAKVVQTAPASDIPTDVATGASDTVPPSELPTKTISNATKPLAASKTTLRKSARKSTPKVSAKTPAEQKSSEAVPAKPKPKKAAPLAKPKTTAAAAKSTPATAKKLPTRKSATPDQDSAPIAVVEKSAAAPKIRPVKKAVVVKKAVSPKVAAKASTAASQPASVPSLEGMPVQLKKARVGGKDDLKLISGIGPKIEDKLNDLGIFHFDQIAAWDEKATTYVDDSLSFKGRIARENWIEQAKKRTTDVS